MERRFSARTYLLGLIAVAVTPVWVFAAYLLVSFAMAKQEEYRNQAVELARQSAVSIDGALSDMLIRTDGLARSIDPRKPDLKALHEDASRLVQGTDQIVSLCRMDGAQLLNTQYAYGAALPDLPASSVSDGQELEGGRTRISDVQTDPSPDGPMVSVTQPVSLGAETLALVMMMPTRRLGETLQRTIPQNWIVGVADRSGVYVTRSERHAEVSGKPGLPQYLAKAVGRSGTFTSSNQFGDILLAGYYRSNFSGWLYAANIRLSAVEAPLWQSFYGILGLALVALLASGLLTYFAGRALNNETDQLVKGAIALGSRQPVALLQTRLAEYALVSNALVRAEHMLLERTQELGAVLETAPVAVWFTYDRTGREVIRNRFAAELMGLPDEDRKHFGVPDQVINTVAIKDGREVSRDDRPLTRAMRGEHTDSEEYSYILLDGQQRHLLTSARPILNQAGEVVGAVQISLDITERKRGEEQRQMLTNELNHRVKNNLAVVQSLAQQTIRNSAGLEEAGSTLGARIAALGTAHDILTRNSWEAGSLRQVIEGSVLAQASSNRIEINGRDLSIPPNLVMALTLTLHELATNAIKYGAWSTASGRVLIAWEETQEPHRLVLTWTERGGPIVGAPSKSGFGTRLLKGITAGEGGSVEVSFEEGGLVATIGLPI